MIAAILVTALNTYVSISGRSLSNLPNMTRWYQALRISITILVITLLVHYWNLAESLA